MADTIRDQRNRLMAQLKSERTSFDSHYRELSEYCSPRRSRFIVSDSNKGDRRNNKIINSVASTAIRTLKSGMMTGITSPARPWFNLSFSDPDLIEHGPVKHYLHTATQRMRNVFLKSNLYKTLPSVYGDAGVFATGAMLVETHPTNIIHTTALPVGSYWIGCDEYGRIRVFMREFRLTVRQIVQKFGQDKNDSQKINWDNISLHVKNLWDTGSAEQWIEICHVIEPNKIFDANKALAKFKKYSSVYFEKGMGSSKDSEKCLSESGYDYFPVLAPRWDTTGEDVYGTDSPGMMQLGDVKALQLMEKRKAQAIEKIINPPMQAHPSLRNHKLSILPGDTTYHADRNGSSGFRPVHEVRINLADIRQDISEMEYRIKKGFYEDLFLMLASSDRRQFTATEVSERKEEKLLALGPVLENLNDDMLDPLIDITFMLMEDAEILPEVPEELAGKPLKVEYVSIMAEAQKIAGVGNIERLMGFAGNIAQIDPSALEKVNGQRVIEIYAEMLSTPPGVIRTKEEMEAIAQQKAEAAQQQQQMAAMQQGVAMAKDLSQANTSQDNLLGQLTQAEDAGAMA